jgi:hypothetical protein
VYGRAFYEQVADALTGFLPPSLRDFQWYRTSANLKLWYGEEGREHYEAQIVKIGPKKVDLGLEIGFHAEHKDVARNDGVLSGLVGAEKRWRTDLGKEPEIGDFIGHQSKVWRRISEVWTGVTDDPFVAVDAAERLAVYITSFEPIRRGARGASPRQRKTPPAASPRRQKVRRASTRPKSR